MRAIDANVVIRLVARDDLVQEATARKTIDNPFMLLPTVVLECEWALRSVYRLPREHIADGLEMLLGHESATVISADALRFALAAYRAGADFGDMLHVGLAAEAGATSFATFEKRMAIGIDTPTPIESLA